MQNIIKDKVTECIRNKRKMDNKAEDKEKDEQAKDGQEIVDDHSIESTASLLVL